MPKDQDRLKNVSDGARGPKQTDSKPEDGNEQGHMPSQQPGNGAERRWSVAGLGPEQGH